MPLYTNRYYPEHNYNESPTPLSKLLEVYNEAKKIGFHYVYIGNIGPGTPYENTYCTKCGKTLIVRYGTRIIEWNLTQDNRCPRCGYRINIRGKHKLELENNRWRTIV